MSTSKDELAQLKVGTRYRVTFTCADGNFSGYFDARINETGENFVDFIEPLAHISLPDGVSFTELYG